MKRIKLTQKARNGKTKVLIIWTKGSVIHRRWGYEDGKMQESTKIVKGKNTGRANATTAQEQAKLEAERIIERKVEEGYCREGETNGNGVFSFDPLPSSFAPSKPYTNKPPDIETNIGDYCAERKNNGVNLLRVVDLEGNNHIYTRGIKEITHVVERIRPIQAFNTILLPPGTIASYEFIIYDETGKETPKDLRGIVSDRTTEEKAYKRFETLVAEGYTFSLKVFDLLFYDGEDQTAKEYTARRALLQRTIWSRNDRYRSEFFFKLTQDAIDRAKDRGWEGFILRKMTGPKSTVEFTLNGKPYRKGAWKYVFEKTGDFHIIEVQIGAAGRLAGLPARFHLVQYNDAGEQIDCQWSGPGRVVTSDLIQLSKDLGLNGVKPKSVHKVNGLTAEVVFRNYQETNALEFPVIHHIRDDKPVEECLYGEQS